MRPPGGMTTDMFNYANDIDIYMEWAYIIVYNRFVENYSRKYHCEFHRAEIQPELRPYP